MPSLLVAKSLNSASTSLLKICPALHVKLGLLICAPLQLVTLISLCVLIMSSPKRQRVGQMHETDVIVRYMTIPAAMKGHLKRTVDEMTQVKLKMALEALEAAPAGQRPSNPGATAWALASEAQKIDRALTWCDDPSLKGASFDGIRAKIVRHFETNFEGRWVTVRGVETMDSLMFEPTSDAFFVR